MWRLPLGGSVLALTLLLSTSAQAATLPGGDGLGFRDTQVLTLSLAQLKAGFRIPVCNGGGEPAVRLEASREGFSFTRDGTLLPDRAILAAARLLTQNGVTTVRTLPPGACAALRLELVPRPETLDSGSFSGVVTVTSAREGIAQRRVTIAGPTATTVAPQTIADTVTVNASRNWGPFNMIFGVGSTHLRDNGNVALKAPPAGDKLDIQTCQPAPAKCPSVGVVVHDQNTGVLQIKRDGVVSTSDGIAEVPLAISGANAIGDYTGSVDLPGNDDPNQAIKVDVNVSDSVWWMLFALLLGCGLSVVLQLIQRRWNRKSAVDARIDALSDDYQCAETKFQKSGEPALLKFRVPSTDTVAEYAAAARDAFDNYLKSTIYIDPGSAAYTEVDNTIKTAEDDIACWKADLAPALGALLKAKRELVKWIGDVAFAAKAPAVAAAAAEVLRGHTLAIGEAINLKATASQASSLLADWQRLAMRVLQLQEWWSDLAPAAATGAPAAKRMTVADRETYARAGAVLVELKYDLLGSPDAAALKQVDAERRLRQSYDDFAYLGGRYGVLRPPADRRAARPPSAVDASRVAAGTFAVLAPAPVAKELIESWFETTCDRTAAGAKAAKIGKSRRIVGDVIVLVCTIAASLGTALVAVGLGKNFGTAQDYLTVIVIGTAAQALTGALLAPIDQLLADLTGTIVDAPAQPSAPAA